MIEFKIELTNVTKQTLGFNLSYEEGTAIKLTLPVKVFTDFAIGLGALVWTDEELTNEQLKTLWKLKVNVFDGSERVSSIFVKYKDRMALIMEK